MLFEVICECNLLVFAANLHLYISQRFTKPPSCRIQKHSFFSFLPLQPGVMAPANSTGSTKGDVKGAKATLASGLDEI